MNENENDKALTTVKDKGKKLIKNGVPQEFNNEFNIQKVVNTISKLQYSESELKVLHAPFEDDDLDIKSTGIVYAPWVSFVRRIRTAFKGSYMFLPHGEPRPSADGKLIVWPHYFFIKGHLVNYAIGECPYIPTNLQMSYGDAIEGSKSNAIMRCCKGIGIGLELWDRKFTEKWKEKNAYLSNDTDKNGDRIWKRNVGTKKPLYIKLIRYLFELLDINEKVFLKQKGKVAIELCKEDELNVFKNELEKKIKEKFYPKSAMKEAGKTKPKNDLIILINDVVRKLKKNKAWLITQLMAYNITDMNKATVEDLKMVYKNIAKGIKKDSKAESKKPEKNLEDLLNDAESLAKEKGIDSTAFTVLVKKICGKDIGIAGMKKVVKHLELIEAKK